MAKSRPRVILNAAISIDGKIATRTGDSKLSSGQDIKRVHTLRGKVDAVLVGKNTVKRDNPLLTVRFARGKNPLRIILDSKGEIASKSKILKTCKKVPTLIAVSKNVSKKNLCRLQKHQVDVIILGENKIDIKKLLIYLGEKKIRTILLEGGGTVNWEFIKNDLVDDFIITITPFLIGGKDAITLVQGQGFSKIIKSKKLKLNKISRYGNEIVTKYMS